MLNLETCAKMNWLTTENKSVSEKLFSSLLGERKKSCGMEGISGYLPLDEHTGASLDSMLWWWLTREIKYSYAKSEIDG